MVSDPQRKNNIDLLFFSSTLTNFKVNPYNFQAYIMDYHRNLYSIQSSRPAKP